MRKGNKGRPIGDTLGGIIVGFHQQIFRTTPPAQELVAKGEPVRGISGEDGSEFEVVFPPVEPGADAPTASTDPTVTPARLQAAPSEVTRRRAAATQRFAPPKGGA